MNHEEMHTLAEKGREIAEMTVLADQWSRMYRNLLRKLEAYGPVEPAVSILAEHDRFLRNCNYPPRDAPK